ncbi:Uncharacterised protein [Klebsiella pneumoniae]|nr:hypothetical protein AI2771V2_4484 [Klebsiella pneumoniae]CAF9608561.1 hypothetical protein AI3044V1_4534 [Klebsiella pneumoniae]CAH4149892.1 hypothetical protein AI2771V2_4484 [Klebsiella pneumoniae]CAH6218924.1 hypothetical protein AI3044V1_4534 [Klebsiella pneumoniae]VAO40651.1 Uncharacterised protein [Klebsiella pneumoniae]
MPYPAYVPSCGTPPQDRQAQRRRAGHFKLRTCGCAGWRHKCLIRPTFLPAGSPPRTGKRSAAGRSGAVPAVVPDAGINALSGLRSFPQAHTPVGPASAAPPGSWPRPTPSVHRQAQGQILRVGIKIVLRLQVAIRILGQIVLKQRQRGEDRQQPGAIVEDHLPQLAALAAV